jgi:hypothetical protein
MMVAMLAISIGIGTPIAAQEASPPNVELAESDAMWGGNFVDNLPDCEANDLCMASLTQSERGDEYYFGVIQNNSEQWVKVETVTATLLDQAGEVAAIGDSVAVEPPIVSPGGHALVMITVAGEYISEFTFETEFVYEPGTGEPDGFGVPVQVDQVTIRGNGVLGEVTNTSSYDFGVVRTDGVCMSEAGDILYWFQGEANIRPFPAGETARFSADIYGDVDCTNFVVVAWGNPYA